MDDDDLNVDGGGEKAVVSLEAFFSGGRGAGSPVSSVFSGEFGFGTYEGVLVLEAVR